MYKNKSISENKWFFKKIDERKALYFSQKYNLSIFLSKQISLFELNDQEIFRFLNPDITNDIPDPLILKDMQKAVLRTIQAINKSEKIGILADYDVDGSTSATILYKFLKTLNLDVSIKVPERLSEGYGPNNRILDEFLKEQISVLFILDCGTTAFKTLNNQKYSPIDIIVVDHHISESNFPNVYALINPNRYDENKILKDLAAVGVTFFFLIALRKKLRDKNYFVNKKEPNLLNYLDMVAIGTICDVVSLNNINRTLVIKGLELIKLRKSRVLLTILDNSNLKSEPTSEDIGYILGPQINAASRLGESSLATTILISNDVVEIDSISKKLYLLNEKRKLIEAEIFSQALKQININNKNKYILIYGENWHTGVLGIVASRLLNQYFKPVIVISFFNNIGVGSARSIDSINLGNIILEAKNQNLLISGGGHSMAAGLKIKKNTLNDFKIFLDDIFNQYPDKLFEKINIYNEKISINEINSLCIKDLKIMEPFGKGNEQPNFVFTDVKILSIKKIKEKHIIVFFKNISNIKIKGICFNSVNTILGDYLEKYDQFKFDIGGVLKEDTYAGNFSPQIIIKDIMILN